MARARNLKPGFFRDAKVVSCSFQARILFQGLWCMADYMGRLKYNPMEVKMEIFPADDVDVPACMEELSSTGLITMYHDCSGAALVQVTNFTKHQNPHINERQDRNKNPIPCLPGPDEVAAGEGEEGEEKPTVEQQVRDALVVLREYSESDPADSLNLIPDSLFPLPDSGSPRAETPPPAGSAGKQRKPKRATRLPENFEPSENNRQVAAEQGVSIHDQLPQFRDYHRAKGSTMKDWHAALNTWLRNARKFDGGRTGKPPQETPHERGQRMARERGIIQ